jgi:hypothetical protein
LENTLNIQIKSLSKRRAILYLSLISVAIIWLASSINIFSVFGIGISIYLLLRLLIMMNDTIPVLEVMLLIASSQWIIGPLIDYQTEVTHYQMHMYVSEDRYMEITVPLFYIFTLATLQFIKFSPINKEALKQILTKHKNFPLYIIGIGFVFNLINPFVPVSLAFVSYLTINLSLIGLGLLYFLNITWINKFIITGIVFIPITYSSISTGMFHDLIIWGLFTFIFMNLAKPLPLAYKIIIITVSISFLFILQLVKNDYREIISDSSFRGNKFEVFIDLLVGNQDLKRANEEININGANARLNQGWIISKIYERIPSKKDFIGGETIIDAIDAAVMPRFLFPDKKKGGSGRETFTLLTGFELNKRTAMGVSLLGEFYANYGFYGSIIAFIIWGKLLNFIVFAFGKLQKKSPIILFCLPIVFFQVIKAETDLTTVLNHLVKSIIFISIIMFFIRKTLNMKI